MATTTATATEINKFHKCVVIVVAASATWKVQDLLTADHLGIPFSMSSLFWMKQWWDNRALVTAMAMAITTALIAIGASQYLSTAAAAAVFCHKKILIITLTPLDSRQRTATISMFPSRYIIE